MVFESNSNLFWESVELWQRWLLGGLRGSSCTGTEPNTNCSPFLPEPPNHPFFLGLGPLKGKSRADSGAWAERPQVGWETAE